MKKVSEKTVHLIRERIEDIRNRINSNSGNLGLDAKIIIDQLNSIELELMWPSDKKKTKKKCVTG